MKFIVFYLQLINSLEGLRMFFFSAALVCRLRRYAATVILQIKKSYDPQYGVCLDGQSEVSAGQAQGIQ